MCAKEFIFLPSDFKRVLSATITATATADEYGDDYDYCCLQLTTTMTTTTTLTTSTILVLLLPLLWLWPSPSLLPFSFTTILVIICYYYFTLVLVLLVLVCLQSFLLGNQEPWMVGFVLQKLADIGMQILQGHHENCHCHSCFLPCYYYLYKGHHYLDHPCW